MKHTTIGLVGLTLSTIEYIIFAMKEDDVVACVTPEPRRVIDTDAMRVLLVDEPPKLDHTMIVRHYGDTTYATTLETPANRRRVKGHERHQHRPFYLDAPRGKRRRK